MKIKRYLIIYALSLALLIGCSHMPDSYPFAKQNDAIEIVELLYHPQPSNLFTTKDYLLIYELPSDEIIQFMNSIQALDTEMCTTPPPRGYGEYVVRVMYNNGDMEIFGNYHIEFVASGEDEAGIGKYVFNPVSAFEELFKNYGGSQNELEEMWLRSKTGQH